MRRILYKSFCFWFRGFFWHLVVFCQCGLESLEVLESFVTFEGWVILPMKSHQNDEYLSQFFTDCKVLWMTFKHFFEILIQFDMSDCNEAILTYIHSASFTLGLFWVRKFKNFLENLPVLGSNRLTVLVWTSQKIRSKDMTRIIPVDQ